MSAAQEVDEYSHFFEVRLELFDGPIDLLLHLVKQRELPIEMVSLAQVTEQYLQCIERARAFDLDVAGEYLVIAATLLSIKASVLLNDPVELIEDDEGNLVDPHQELLRRLREAEIYREGARFLGDMKILGIDVFAPPSLVDRVEPLPAKLKPHDPYLLGVAFKRLLEQAGDRSGLTITIDSISIMERMVSVLDTLRNRREPVRFEALVPDRTSRASIIGVFVALLELCKRQAIAVRQDENFDAIYIVLSDESVSLENFESEFDVKAGVG